MTLRRIVSMVMGSVLAALCLPAAASISIAVPDRGNEALRLPGTGDSTQVVLVTAKSVRSTTASLATYERAANGWKQVGDSTTAFLGRHGLVQGSQRRQSTGTTPMGTYALNAAFGRLPDPGGKLPYIRIDRNDAWTYNPRDPSTYNLFQSVDRSWASYGGYVEHLWQLGPQYDYVVTTGFNEPTGKITKSKDGVRRATNPSDTRRGGGIFLHVSKGEPTVGCVSMPRFDMLRLVRWLDPAAHPKVVIGLESEFRGAGPES